MQLICTSVATSDNKDALLTIHIAHFCGVSPPPFSFATQEFSRAEQVAFRVRKSDERAVGQQWQAAAGGAPEEVSGGQLQAERIAAGGTLIQMHKVFVQPEPRPKPTALHKRPQRLQICWEAAEEWWRAGAVSLL